jgi:hypothetical protein
VAQLLIASGRPWAINHVRWKGGNILWIVKVLQISSLYKCLYKYTHEFIIYIYERQSHAQTIILPCSRTRMMLQWPVQPIILGQTDHRLVGWVPCGGTCTPGFKSSTWHNARTFIDLFQD